MITKNINRLAICVVVTAIFTLTACANAQPTDASTNSTNLAELDNIIDIVLRGDTDELKSVIKLTQVKCTLADGLGGPPKCLEDEKEGTIVEALPILDSEGHFLRKDDLETWKGLDVSALFAVYETSEIVYSDENYPAGEYAIVFINKNNYSNVTLQVNQGKIIRLDYRYEFPPSIPDENVTRYLIQPIGVNP